MSPDRPWFAAMTRPSRVALIGGSDRPGSVGLVLARSLSGRGARHVLDVVNPRRPTIGGRTAFASVADLPERPDLAVVAAPASAVIETIEALGEAGCGAAIVISAGFEDPRSDLVRRLKQAAVGFGVRFLGPNCLGVLSSARGLNASFAADPIRAGRVAVVSQSGAVGSAMLRWAGREQVGFSHVFTVGNALDIGFPELLDALAADSATAMVALYIEGFADGAEFVEAAGRLSAVKPVLALKAGRGGGGAKAAFSHTGALAGADAAYDAAFRRSGVRRVETLDALLDGVAAFSRLDPLEGTTLAVVTNGGGGGVLAADALERLGGRLAVTSESGQARMRSALPPTATVSGPIDILGDGGPTRYAKALEIAVGEPDVDALLVINCPTAVADGEAIARTVAEASRVRAPGKPSLLGCWMGGARSAERTLRKAGIPVFPTPERAAAAFLALQRLRAESPEPVRLGNRQPIRRVLDAAIDAGREILQPREIQAILAACDIPLVAQREADTPDDAAWAAAGLGGPVVLKIRSPDLSHKSDVGGVVAGLEDADAVRRAASEMLERVAGVAPAARIDGFLVQRLAEIPGAQELIVGLTRDPVFGAVVLVGAGGVAVQVDADHAIAIAPVDRDLALATLDRTRISGRLRGYRNSPPANREAVADIATAVSALGAAFPEIVELDINPLLVGAQGALALDARIRIQAHKTRAPRRDGPER